MRRAAAILSAIFFGVVAAACGLGQAIDGVVFLPTSRPAEADLVGRWRIHGRHVAEAKEWYGIDAADAEIVLAPDGTITWRRVPDVLVDKFEQTDPRLVDRRGKWTLATRHDVWRLDVDVERPDAGKCATEITIWNRSAPYRLALNGDDPDECHYVFFDRDAAASAVEAK